MGNVTRAALLAAAIACAGAPVSAQMLSGVKVEPANVRAGETATVTVSFDVMGGVYCGVRLHFGDGTSEDYRINQAKDVPLVVRRAWPAAGSYAVKAEPKSQGMLPKCGGRNQEAMLVVSAPAAAAPASPKPPAQQLPPSGSEGKPTARTSPCPAGWTLNRAGVGKNGAFTCIANRGTAVPEPRIACPGDMTYFENVKRGQLGCRP